MGVVYAYRAPTLPPPPSLWVKTSVTWTGWDGSVWDLTTPESGVALMNQGVEGLHMPSFRQWTRQSPGVHGQRFTGMVAEPRTVVLPVLVFSDGSSQNWLDHDRAFWKSLHPAREGVLTVASAGTGSRRSIRLRLVPEDYAFPLDPAFATWAQYIVQLVADNPFWEGEPIRGAWQSGSSQEFYETSGPQLINLNSGHTLVSAAITNDGDEDAWPVWKVIGPATGAHMGVGDKLVEVPFTVTAGKALVVDTDPRIQTAIEYDYTAPDQFSNPVDRTADLTGAVSFAPIPAGGTSPININLTGAGAIQIEVKPLFWRAW